MSATATAPAFSLNYDSYAEALARKQELEAEGAEAWRANVASAEPLGHAAFYRLPAQRERRLIYQAVCREVWRLSRIEHPDRWI
jgi:hypothetical protein